MGGIMAMIMAMIAPQALIGMVINDVGPELDVRGLERIKSYVGKSPPIRSWADATARAKETNEVAFPDYSDDDWLAFARRTYHEVGGVPVSSYDPGISGAFDPDGPVVAPPDMWGIWETLKEIPVLGMRGELSDLLSELTFGRMLETHPGMRAVTVANRGHAPMLDEPEAISAIEAFLADLEALEK
ncbi:MAG TPA: alpha/beta hydrolase [Devosia sp.]|nr:alpha/beta hydrolase [Devosia sp.]